MNDLLRVGMVAGEISGDNLAASLIRSLSTRTRVECFGIGGPAMAAEGFDSWFHFSRLQVNGFVDPIKRLPELIHILLHTRNKLLAAKPDVFVGVDFNFFNLLLEGLVRKAGVPTVHYVSPSVWAWRRGRIRQIQRNVDLMLTLYPFETGIYAEHGIEACFVGHPKADELPLQAVPVAPIRRQLGLSSDSTVIAMLPGSRRSEVESSGRDFLAALVLCQQRLPSMEIVIGAANADRRLQIEALHRELAPSLRCTIVDDSLDAMRAADLVLVNAGTATLEAMLLKKPMVMSYRLGKLTYALVSRLVQTPFFALPNILAGTALVPEFIQDEATPEKLAEAVLKQLGGESDALLQSFAGLHKSLRRKGGERAAEAVLALCDARRRDGRKDGPSVST